MLYFFKESLREQVVRLIMLLKKQGYSSSFFLEVKKSFVFRKFCLVFLRLDSLKGLFEVELHKWEAHIFIKRSCS
jgi:hypothetical protein